jgi:hypothetical protein
VCVCVCVCVYKGSTHTPLHPHSTLTGCEHPPTAGPTPPHPLRHTQKQHGPSPFRRSASSSPLGTGGDGWAAVGAAAGAAAPTSVDPVGATPPAAASRASFSSLAANFATT